MTHRTGDMCFLPPGTEHELCVNDDSLILNVILRASSFERLFQPVLVYDSVLTRFFHRHFSPASPQEFLLFHTGEDEELRRLLLTVFLECGDRPLGFEQTTTLWVQQMFFLLARRFHYTPELIRQLTRQTFMSILHSARVKEAKRLLENTHMSVRAISDAAGYANPESFIRIFRRETGMTPTAFRKGEGDAREG